MSTQLDVVAQLSDLSERDMQFRSRPELEGFREELRTARDNAFAVCQRIEDTAAGRPLTAPQRSDFDAATRRVADAGHLVEAVEQALADKQVDYSQLVHVGGGDVDARALLVGSPDRYDGGPLSRSQTFVGAVRAAGLVRDGEEQLSLGRYLRGVVVGDWRGADPERRAMSEGVLASGGYLVPTILSASIIDKARNRTQVMRAGARLIPMPNRTLDVAKWVGDPSPVWHSEAAAITASDGTIGKVTLDAKALAGLTVVSRELLEDAAGVDDQLRAAFAAQFALTVDKAALYGSGTAPEPRGVKLTSGITTLSLGANGSALQNYDWLVDAVGTLADLNEQATGVIYAPRTSRVLGKLKDTTNQPLTPPTYIGGLARYDSNQVPTTLSQGTATTASDAFTGDWSQLLIGVRTGLQIQVLNERYADTGQIGLLCWWRGDVAVARPAAFVVTTGIL